MKFMAEDAESLKVVAPMLAGSRDRARELLADLPGDLRGRRVRLCCRALAAATIAFADELVRTVLDERGAEMLEVMSAFDGEFTGYVWDRALVYGVADRVVVSP